jgi:hypothetical protein
MGWRSSWQAVKEHRPVPAELRDVAEVVIARRAAGRRARWSLGAPWIFGDARTPRPP